MQLVIDNFKLCPSRPAGARVCISEGSEEFYGGAGANDALLILRSCLGTLCCSVGSRNEFWEINFSQQLVFAIQNADVWPIEFVSRQGQKIAVQRAHVCQLVRYIVNGIKIGRA